MDDQKRIRISWSPRSQRPWCPGATQPTATGLDSGPTGWTSFFKKGVVGRLKRRGEVDPNEISEIPPALPARDPNRVSPSESPAPNEFSPS